MAHKPTPKPPVPDAELQETARRLMLALDHIAAQDSRMTLGLIQTLLAVAALNGPRTPEAQRLAQNELAAATNFREEINTFSANLISLSEFVVKLPSGKTTTMNFIERYREGQRKIPILAPDGTRLIADMCRVLRLSSKGS